MSEPAVLGEIVGSDSQGLEIECHRLYCAPAFGSFIRADCPSGISQFGVVTCVRTGPVDGNRIVQAHRMAPGELEQRKPHLPSLLRTTFTARVVGYGNDHGQVAATPAHPARLHCFVYAAATAEIRGLTATPGFLRPLTQIPDAPLEDLLVAALQAAREAWGTDEKLIQWGKYLARLLHRDYVTLEGVFQRLGQPVSSQPGWEAPAAFFGQTS